LLVFRFQCFDATVYTVNKVVRNTIISYHKHNDILTTDCLKSLQLSRQS